MLDCYEIINSVKEILRKEPSVLQINLEKNEDNDLIVVGDIHGNINILIRIFSSLGYPSTRKYLFLGDYIDRGGNSLEVLILLYAYKILFPENVYLIRGNHEFRDMATNYGFKTECITRIPTGDDGYSFFNAITDTFPYLPVCAIVNHSIFCVHGGITALLDNLSDLLRISKVGHEFTSDDSAQVEFMWNDPKSSIEYSYEHSPRGVGCIFNRDALDSFLKTMNFSMVIRGHQMCNDGFDFPFGKDGGILTVFSSINYCGELNAAAVAAVSDDNKISTKIFNEYENRRRFCITPPEVFFGQKSEICPPPLDLNNQFKLDNMCIPISI